MKNNNMISVIIPNYNGEKYIDDCLESLEKQTYRNFEVIIIDDGSKDKSVEIIKKYIDKSSLNINLIQQFNQNASIARNRGIELAKGDYLFFLDSDDMLCNDKVFEIMIDKIDENDLLIGDYSIINEVGENIEDYLLKDNLIDCENKYKYSFISPVPSNKLYKASVVKETGLYFGNVRIGQDLNFFLKYLYNIDKIVTIDEKIYKYRIVSTGMTKSINMNFLDIHNSFMDVKKNCDLDIYEKHYAPVEVYHYHGQLIKVDKIKKHYMRKTIFNYFDFCIKDIKIKKSNKTKLYNREMKKYKVKKLLLKTHMFRIVKKLKNRS